MKIQIISDVHLEFYEDGSYNFVKPTAPILCILGDLCCCDTSGFVKIKRFFDKINNLFKLIIWVPGNHEYYQSRCMGKNGTTASIDIQSIKLCCSYPNIKFLKNNRVEYLQDRILYRFIGTPLWTYIPPKLGKKVEKLMSDYAKIHIWNSRIKQPRCLTYRDVNMWHKREKGYIQKEVENSKKIIQNLKRRIRYRNIKSQSFINKSKKNNILPIDYISVKTIVLTHHKPFISTNNMSEIERVAYESNQSDLLNSGYIDAWCYGHTHEYHYKKIGKCIVASNPRGYPREKTGFKIGFGIIV